MTSRDLFALANAAAMTASTIPGGTGVPALEVCCMLVVKVELWPDRSNARAREIRRAQCANVSGLTPTSDHVAIIVDEHGRRASVVTTARAGGALRQCAFQWLRDGQGCRWGAA
ncbi:MAG: hypothetical protein M5T61_20410 [Acidimicrobiia bacterium]|nr:hypothetical protein [Acidimicrobiia bacterium]